MMFKNYINTPTQTEFKAVTINVSHTLTIEELACLFVASYAYDSKTAIIDLAKTLTQKEIIKQIKLELKIDGEDRASYVVGDNHLDNVSDQVVQIFKKRLMK